LDLLPKIPKLERPGFIPVPSLLCKKMTEEEDLYTAARDGDLATVRSLLRTNIDVNWKKKHP